MIWYLESPIGKDLSPVALPRWGFSRPSTPMEEVLQNSFGEKWIESMSGRQANQKKGQADVTVGRGFSKDLSCIFLVH